MKKVFLFLFSLLYIFIEIGFRIKFIDIAGNPTYNTTVIENLEVIGRLIASVGFSIILYSVLSKYFEKKRFKTLFVLIGFVSFFFFQKALVEGVVDSFTNEYKKDLFYTQIYKDNLYNIDEFRDNKFFHADGDYSSEEKTFFVNLPLIDSDAYKFALFNEKTVEENIDFFAQNYAKKNKEFLNWLSFYTASEYKKGYDEYIKASRQFSKYEKKYDLDETKKLLLTLAGKTFSDYRKEVMSTFIYNYYTGNNSRNGDAICGGDPIIYAMLNADVKNPVTSTFTRNGYVYKDNFWMLTGCFEVDVGDKLRSDVLSYEHFETYLKKQYREDDKLTVKQANDFINFANNEVKNLFSKNLPFNVSKLDIIDKFKNNVEICEIYSSFEDTPKEFQYNMGESGIIVYSRNSEGYKYIKYDIDSKDYYFAACNIEKTLSKIEPFLFKLLLEANKEIYRFNKDIYVYSEFIKTDYFKKKLKAKIKTRGIDIFDGFDINNSRHIRWLHNESYNSEIMKKKIHLANMIAGEDYYSFDNKPEIEFNLDFEDFMNNKVVKEKLKKEAPFLVYENKVLFKVFYSNVRNSVFLNKISKSFSQYLSSELKVVHNDIKNEKYDSKYLTEFSKASFFPMFVLLVSTTMILLNILNLFLMFINNKYLKYSLQGIVLLLIALVPINIKFNNINENIANQVDVNKYHLWVQNTSLLMEKFDYLFAPSVYTLDYVEYTYNEIYKKINEENKASIKSRQNELRKKL